MNQLVATKLGQDVVVSGSDGGFSVTPQSLSDIVEFAKFMCQSSAGIPAFLRGNGPDCAAVTMQAMKWGFDPFSVAQKSYKVKDIIAYEAQLIAAVVNARSGIKGRLKYAFNGEGQDMTCTVTGILDGDECTYTSPMVGSITTKNSPLWKSDPQQQLGYFSARSWARRHVPEVLLGVYDREEAEQFQGFDTTKNATPSVMQRLQQRQESAQQQEGFNAEFVTRETETLASGQTQQEPSSATLDNHSAVDHLTVQDKISLRELIIRLKAAVGDDAAIITATAQSFNAAGFELSDYAKAKARTITKHFIAACTGGDLDPADALSLACGVAQIDEAEVQ